MKTEKTGKNMSNVALDEEARKLLKKLQAKRYLENENDETFGEVIKEALKIALENDKK